MAEPSEPLRILLVAEDPGQIRRMGEGLQRQESGRVVLEGADSLATAKRRLSAGDYDLAVIDLALSEGSGVDALEDFRDIAPDVPVVALARPGVPADLQNSAAAGASDCIGTEALACAGLVDRLRAASARFRAEDAELRRHLRAESALEAAGDLAWYWEPAGDVWLRVPDPAAWGLPAGEATESIEAIRERIHPDDRERVVRFVEESLTQVGAWHVEARLRLGGGGYRWCECRGRVRRNAGGVLEFVAGVVADVQRRQNAVRELERGRRQLRALLDSDPVPTAVVNASGFVTDCNRAWMEFDEPGSRAGASLGPGTSFLPEAGGEAPAREGCSADDLAKGVRQVLGGVVGHFSFEYGADDHRWRVRVFPLLNPGIAGAIVRHEDVTADRLAAAQASVRLADAEAALGALPGPCFRLGADFAVREANEQARALCPREPMNKDLLRVLPRGDADAVAGVLAEAAQGEGPAWKDATGRGGATRRWGARAIRGNGRVEGFLVLAVDISDILAEEASMAPARDAALASPVGIALVERKGDNAVIRWANPAFAGLGGKPAEATAGTPLGQHLAAAGKFDGADLAKATAEPAAASRMTLQRPDGAAWELAFAPAGRLACVTAADVTDRERAVASLTHLRRRLQAVLRGSGDGGWEWDEATGQGWLSPRALEILGLPPDTPEDRFEAATESVHRGDRARLATAMAEAAREGGQLEIECRLAKPEGAWIEVRGQAARGSRALAGTLRDVTEARRVREAHEARERRAILALSGASLGTWSWSSPSGKLRVDGRTRQFHGGEGEPGRFGLRDWLRRVDAGDRRRVLKAVARPPSDGMLKIEYRVAGTDRVVAVGGHILGSEDGERRRADGICRDVTALQSDREAASRAAAAVTTTLGALPGMAARVAPDGRLVWENAAWRAAFPGARTLAEAISPENCVDLEPRLKNVLAGESLHGPLVIPVSGQPRHVEAFWAPVGEGGDFVVVLHDFTEERESDSRLFQMRKMEAVGQLAGGVAHEFNNLLGVIVGSLELLETDVGATPGPKRRLAAALGAARQGSDVARRLLAFARQQDLEPEPVDLEAFIRSRSERLGRLLGAGCVLELSLAEDGWTVDVDPGQLETSLVHLVANASEAMPNGGRVKLSSRSRVLDADAARARVGPSAAAGDYVEIVVEDTGPGIPEPLAGRVFDPFFTTKGQGRAAGLGLSMVWGFAQQSGGRAFVEPGEGGGARVGLMLPRSRPAGGVSAAAASAEPARPRRTVLVVEPDAGLRETAADLLASLGWEARTAADAEAALKVLQTAGADLLFTEIDPGGSIDGPTLARRAVARHPNLRVVFSASREGPASGSEHAVISKPYGRRELAAALKLATEGEEASG